VAAIVTSTWQAAATNDLISDFRLKCFLCALFLGGRGGGVTARYRVSCIVFLHRDRVPFGAGRVTKPEIRDFSTSQF
jgi:hypothetical protein